jgi:hypothetical protein
VFSFLLKIKLFFNPPQKGDIFYGNPKYFIVGKPIEQVLHSMKDISGDSIWYSIPSDGCYKVKVCEKNFYHYIVECEVLSLNKITGKKNWLKRTQNKRISKESLTYLIGQGFLKKAV